MELTTREDIEAPIDEVFRAVSDFDGFERAILRRGAEVVRTDELAEPGIGMRWDASFDYRGKRRKGELELVSFEAPGRIAVSGKSSGLDVIMEVELVEMAPSRTRMDIRTRLAPVSVTGRLLLQPLKLARGALLKKYRQRIAGFAGRIEDRYERRRQRRAERRGDRA